MLYMFLISLNGFFNLVVSISSFTFSFEASSGHYKRDLRKALALLRDTQRVLARERENSLNQSMICQLQEQLMDAEAAKLSALRGRHSLESELAEVRAQVSKILSLLSTFFFLLNCSFWRIHFFFIPYISQTLLFRNFLQIML